MTSANVSQIPVMPVQANVKAQAKAGNEGKDFMQIMSASISNNSASDIRSSVGVAAPVKSQAPTETVETVKPAEPTQAKAATDVSAKAASVTQTASQDANDAAVLTTEEIEEVSEVIATAAVEIVEVIAEDLNVTAEDVTAVLDELDIMPIEVADPKNLADVVSQLTGMDKMELLTDSTLSDITADLKPIVDEMVKDLPIDSAEELPGFAKDFLEMIDAAGMDLGPDGEVVPVSEPLDGLTIASDEIIITNPNEENLISTTEETGDEVVVTPESGRVETPVSRQFVAADENMDEDQLHAVDQYNDSRDEMVTTARNMGSTESDQSAGKDTGRDSFMGKHETGFEHVAHATVDNNPAPVQTTTFAETVTETVTRYTTIDTRALIDQIVTQVRTQVSEGITTMSLELHPATLGKMFVQVTEQDGTVNAKLFTESENVKQALEGAMTALKEQWEQQGSKVNAIEISVGTREFEEQMASQADWNQNENSGKEGAGEAGDDTSAGGSGNRSINLGDGEEGIPEDMTEAEALEANMMRDYGNTLSMRA